LKPVKDFFSELVDFDSRLLRTLVNLFRQPSAVVESRMSGEEKYTGPLRYILFTSSAFIVARFLFHWLTGYNYFFGEVTELADWRIPKRIASVTSNSLNFFDSSFPFVVLILVVPMAILISRALFYKKSWRETAIMVLYSFAQFWIVLILLLPLATLDIPYILTPLLAFFIVYVCFRKVIGGHPVITLGKWVTMSIVLIFWFYEVCFQLTLFTIAWFIPGSDSQYGAVKSDATVLTNVVQVEVDHEAWLEYVKNDPLDRIIVPTEFDADRNGMMMTCIDPEGTQQWKQFFPEVARIRKLYAVTADSSSMGILILADGKETPAVSLAVVVAQSGEILYTKRYDTEMLLNGGVIVNRTLLLAGGRTFNGEIIPAIDAISFEMGNRIFTAIDERTYLLPKVRQRFDELYDLHSTRDKINLLASKYEVSTSGRARAEFIELNEISIVKLNLTLPRSLTAERDSDSLISVDWETQIFRKTLKYSPMKGENFLLRADTLNNRIIACYTLANDSVTPTLMYSLDTKGNLIWKKEIVEDDFTGLLDIHPDATGVYFCGSTFSELIKHPIVGNYGLSLLGHISFDGEVMRRTLFGDFSNNSMHAFYKLVPGDSIRVLSFHMRDNLYGNFKDWELATIPQQSLSRKSTP
jgi:Protein of unknown function (DUF3667)